MVGRMLPALLLALSVVLPARADKRLDEAVAKAEAQLVKGKQAEAVKILQKAASQAPSDPEAQLALARILLRAGQRDEAAVAFGKARELAPAAAASARARVLAGVSAFELRAGTAREALALARLATEAEASGEPLAALARAQARLSDPAARATADQAAQAAPNSAAVQLARGEALLAAHLAREAEAAYRRALELQPRSAAAGSGLALALASQGRGAEAIETARAAAQFDATSAEPLVALGLAALAQDPLDKNSEAAAAVQQAAFLEPKNPLVKLAVGRVFESRGQLEQALAAYDEAARLDPSWAAPRVAALELQSRSGDADGALRGVRALPAELKEAAEAQLLLGKLLLRKEDANGAKAALDLAVAALPGLAEAQAAHGSAAYSVGELTLAADAYGRAVQIEPGGFISLGWLYRNFEPPRVAEAVAAYEKALALNPKNGQAALGVALSYRAGRQWTRAITAYERVSRVDKKLDGEGLLGMAWCYYRSGDTYKASFFTGLAARAGADVRTIRTALTRSARAAAPGAPQAGERSDDDLPELVDQLGSKNGGLQARAVKSLVGLGRPAVPYLAAALSRPASTIAAREALPHLDRLIKEGPPVPGGDDSQEEVARQLREARLLSAMQAAAVRIRAK
jgi:tetratricopeptide (TPR) repeat protein